MLRAVHACAVRVEHALRRPALEAGPLSERVPRPAPGRSDGGRTGRDPRAADPEARGVAPVRGALCSARRRCCGWAGRGRAGGRDVQPTPGRVCARRGAAERVPGDGVIVCACLSGDVSRIINCKINNLPFSP